MMNNMLHHAIQCPHCGYLLSGAALLDGSDPLPPEDGDTSICVTCGRVNIYTNGARSMRKATAAEQDDDDVRRGVAMVLEMWSHGS